MIRKRTV